MKKKKSMWNMMNTTSKEFVAQENRIKEKRKLLEEHGVDVDTSHIKKPDFPNNENEKKKKQSMWEMMQSMEKKFEAQKEYLDKMEKVYEKAIRNILGVEAIID